MKYKNNDDSLELETGQIQCRMHPGSKEEESSVGGALLPSINVIHCVLAVRRGPGGASSGEDGFSDGG